jgi:hypothetical protein
MQHTSKRPFSMALASWPAAAPDRQGGISPFDNDNEAFHA